MFIHDRHDSHRSLSLRLRHEAVWVAVRAQLCPRLCCPACHPPPPQSLEVLSSEGKDLMVRCDMKTKQGNRTVSVFPEHKLFLDSLRRNMNPISLAEGLTPLPEHGALTAWLSSFHF